MSVLARFTKQPVEVQDYDIDFTDYLTALSDTAVSHVVSVETGLTLMASNLTSGIVKVFVSGGVDGNQYKVSATITTAGGRVKQGDIMIRVKEF